MALMFQRIARNFLVNGYYPTDTETTQRVLNLLSPCKQGAMRVIDPCAGEGAAVAECRHHLGDAAEAYAIEYNEVRAVQAKKLTNRCIQGDFQDTIITPRSFGLLWLNPPYGDLISDKTQIGNTDQDKGKKRLEKLFFQQSARCLQYGGVIVLIVPHYTLDSEFRKWLASGFERISVFLAPEQQFKQAVVVGVRRRTDSSDEKYQQGLSILEEFCLADIKPTLPQVWDDETYIVPSSGGEVRFNTIKMDPTQFAEEITKFPCLWDQFSLHFYQSLTNQRRPLMGLSDWHLALALAAGQVSGVVHSNDRERTFVIKGDTFKHKKNAITFEENADGEITEIRTAIDVFIPTIKALDFTPGSATFGQIITIK
jgi:tRNA1(Val) A37 N6-methylase TrmN6